MSSTTEREYTVMQPFMAKLKCVYIHPLSRIMGTMRQKEWKSLCLCVTEKNVIKYTDTNTSGQTLYALFISFNIFLHSYFISQLQPV